MSKLSIHTLGFCALVGIINPAFSSQVPEGWNTSSCKAHEIVVDNDNYRSPEKSYSIKSLAQVTENDTCSLFQNLNVEIYRGKRVKIQAYMKGSTTASIWAEAYTTNKSGKAETIMGASKALTMAGDSPDWVSRSVVLEIPESANSFAFGFLMRKDGQAWIDDISVDVVDKSTPLDGVYTRFLKGPVNLP